MSLTLTFTRNGNVVSGTIGANVSLVSNRCLSCQAERVRVRTDLVGDTTEPFSLSNTNVVPEI